MRRNEKTVVFSVVVVLACFLLGTTAYGQGDFGALFPKSNTVAGWTLQEGPKVYTGNQLFDYMDGAGEIPKSYDFRQLGSAKYQKGKFILEAAIFDMGAAADAFGYYSARSFLEHNPRAKERIIALDHPAHLYSSVGVLTFWKDRYTIILQPESAKTDEAALVSFARAISARIKAKGNPSTLLNRLPREGRVANSERFVRGKSAFDALLLFTPTDVFGMSKKAEAIAAEYTLPGGPATLILIRYPNAVAANAASAAFRQYLIGRKAVVSPDIAPGSFTAMAQKEKGIGAMARGSMLFVVTGARDKQAVKIGLQRLMKASGAK